MDSWFTTDAERYANRQDWWAGNYFGDHRPVGKDWYGNCVHADGSKSYWCPINDRRYVQDWGGGWS